MRLLLCFLFNLLSLLSVFTQFIDLRDGRSLALSGTIEATGENYIGKSNPAGLAVNENLQFGFHYYNRFMLNELGVQSICAVIPVRNGSFAGRINYFGTNSLNESRFIVSYGQSINSWLTAGIDLNYHYLSIGALNVNHSAVSGNLGIVFRPMNDLTIGIFLQNLTNIRFNYDYGLAYPTSLDCGITYSETEKFLISGKLGWMDFQWIDFAFGTEVYLTKNLIVRGGIKIPSSTSYSFGTGLQISRIKFDLGFEQHPVLGLSSSASVILRINRHAR